MREFSRIQILVTAGSIDGYADDSVLVRNGSDTMELASLDVVLNLMPKGSNVLLCATGTVRNETVHRLSRIIARCNPLVALDLSAVSELSRVADSPFRGNRRLYSMRFPSNLAAINSGAFAGCTSLVSVEIPPSAGEIGAGAFLGCTALTRLAFAVPGGWKYLDAKGSERPVTGLEHPETAWPLFVDGDGRYGNVALFR